MELLQRISTLAELLSTIISEKIVDKSMQQQFATSDRARYDSGKKSFVLHDMVNMN